MTNFDMVQDSNTLPQLQRDNTWYGSVALSKTRGAHTFKLGAQLSRAGISYLQSQYVRGQFVFSGAYTQSSQRIPLPAIRSLIFFSDFLSKQSGILDRRRPISIKQSRRLIFTMTGASTAESLFRSGSDTNTSRLSPSKMATY